MEQGRRVGNYIVFGHSTKYALVFRENVHSITVSNQASQQADNVQSFCDSIEDVVLDIVLVKSRPRLTGFRSPESDLTRPQRGSHILHKKNLF